MSEPILSVHNLVGGYGKMTILNGTTFAVPEATITTIIGPNGAGKSTVFKAIFGLLKLREGKISFAGRDVTNLSQRALLNAGICYVPQGRNIFSELSVRQNIELGGVAARRAAYASRAPSQSARRIAMRWMSRYAFSRKIACRSTPSSTNPTRS